MKLNDLKKTLEASRRRWHPITGITLALLLSGATVAQAFDGEIIIRPGEGFGDDRHLESLTHDLDNQTNFTVRLAERESGGRFRDHLKERAIDDLTQLARESGLFRDAVEHGGRHRRGMDLEREFEYVQDAADRADRSISMARFSIQVGRAFAEIQHTLQDIEYTLRDSGGHPGPRPDPKPAPGRPLDFIQVDKMRPAKFGTTTESIRVREPEVQAVRLFAQERSIYVSRVTVEFTDGRTEDLHSLTGSYREGDALIAHLDGGFRGERRSIRTITISASTQGFDGGAGKLAVEVGVPRRR